MSTPDFEQARTELARARTALEQARLRAARTGAEDAGKLATQAREVAAAAAAAFAAYTDPRANVERFPDRSPFALLPVRVETRFAQRAGGDGEREQLWVRIYPDDCWIDTFEPTLSATELANAQRYWRGIWRAGGIEADERAAWRGLVAAHGSGRAGWIVDNYAPSNPADRPVKAAATDVVLVVATQTPLSAAETAAVDAYWQAVWLADGNAAKLAAARTALDGAVGAARAAQLVADYAPYNLADRPAPPLEKKDVTVSTAFVDLPARPADEAVELVGGAARDAASRSASSSSATWAASRCSRRSAAWCSSRSYVGPDPSAATALRRSTPTAATSSFPTS